MMYSDINNRIIIDILIINNFINSNEIKKFFCYWVYFNMEFMFIYSLRYMLL